MKQYIVDAFTDKPFSDNPAAVCVMDKWPYQASRSGGYLHCERREEGDPSFTS